MTFSRKEQWIIFMTVNGCLVMFIALFPIYCKYIRGAVRTGCFMLDTIRIYCPACGGTRAIKALLELDILSSIRYNPIVVVGAAFFAVYEIVMVKGLISGKERKCFIKPWVVYVVMGVWMTYAIVRNVLLCCGIDLVGNVLG